MPCRSFVILGLAFTAAAASAATAAASARLQQPLPLPPPPHTMLELSHGTLASIAAYNMPDVLAAWPKTRIGRLLATPEVRDGAHRVLEHVVDSVARDTAVLLAAQSAELELKPWQAANAIYANQPSFSSFLAQPFDQIRHAVWLKGNAHPDAENPIAGGPSVMLLSCLPQFEGRWTQRFEAQAQQLAASTRYTTQENAKLDGNPAYAFAIVPDGIDTSWIAGASLHRWTLHLPGSFFDGCGNPATIGKITSAAAPQHTGFAVDVHYETLLKNAPQGAMAEPAVRAFGADKLQSFTWRIGIDGELLLDEVAVTTNGETGGLIAMLAGGTAELPDQALPDGAMLQLRAALDLTALTDILPLLELPEMPEALTKQIHAAFDGGIALGCCAPKTGGLIPRIYATLTIADEQSLRDAIESIVPADGTGGRSQMVKKRTLEGVACSVLRIPDLPQGIQPAWCIADGKLHIAESARSLRSLLKAQKTGAVAMDVGDAPLPKGKGEVVDTLELRCDEAQIYESFYEIWLPLYEMANPSSHSAPIQRDDLPEPELVAEYCGKSRGLLRRDGNTWRVQHLGALGGPELAALAMTFGPMLAAEIGNYQTNQLLRAIAIPKLEKLYDAFERFAKRERRAPRDLAELCAAETFDVALLLLPGDSKPETFTLPDGTEVKTSYRYFPEPVAVDTQEGDLRALLVAIRPMSSNRPILCSNGAVPEIYGEQSQRPIDRIGSRRKTQSASFGTGTETTGTATTGKAAQGGGE
ncbi:MAG: hypothetical protein AB8H80_20170 [Planctomycetota bacterium]